MWSFFWCFCFVLYQVYKISRQIKIFWKKITKKGIIQPNYLGSASKLKKGMMIIPPELNKDFKCTRNYHLWIFPLQMCFGTYLYSGEIFTFLWFSFMVEFCSTNCTQLWIQFMVMNKIITKIINLIVKIKAS